jgi:hypothetical protein
MFNDDFVLNRFIPPPTAPVRRRRVVESILLHVQRKYKYSKKNFRLNSFVFYRKKTFEKIVDVLRGTEPPTMSQLGLEFLRIYDGKFNYREGHQVSDIFFPKLI